MVLPSLLPENDAPDGLDETVLAELQTDLGAELFGRLARQALSAVPEELQRLLASEQDENLAGVASAAHRLSGLLGQFGSVAVQDAAGAVEAQPGDLRARSSLRVAVAKTCEVLQERLAPEVSA